MPALQANPAFEELDYNDRTANDEPRYPQWIQAEIQGGNEQTLFDFDYDLVTGDAILSNNAPFVDGHLRTVVRVSGDMRFKDFLRQYYGLRRFTLRPAFLDVPKAADEPKILDQTFRELYRRHQLMQLDIISR
jgi:hypothetical protein